MAEISFGKFESARLREGYRATLKSVYKSKSGGHFFDADTMRFFDSQIEPKAIEIMTDDGVSSEWVFVTSEQFDRNSPRLWSVRHWKGTGKTVDTIGEFQQYNDPYVAATAAKRYAESLVEA